MTIYTYFRRVRDVHLGRSRRRRPLVDLHGSRRSCGGRCSFSRAGRGWPWGRRRPLYCRELVSRDLIGSFPVSALLVRSLLLRRKRNEFPGCFFLLRPTRKAASQRSDVRTRCASSYPSALFFFSMASASFLAFSFFSYSLHTIKGTAIKKHDRKKGMWTTYRASFFFSFFIILGSTISANLYIKEHKRGEGNTCRPLTDGCPRAASGACCSSNLHRSPRCTSDTFSLREHYICWHTHNESS